MKVVILAGGLGTRISEETHLKPKPMVEIGNRPILWHIMKIYPHHGLTDFIICCGYRGYVIKEYFANYFLHNSDVTFDMRENRMHILDNRTENWKVTLVDTGEQTMTGGRLRRVRDHLEPDEPFAFTYGDGVGNADIGALVDFHKAHGRLATVTAVQPPARWGALCIEDDRVTRFSEKPTQEGAWINGGFFVLDPKVIDYMDGDETSWETDPLERLSSERQLVPWYHRGFWPPVDTLRDKTILDELWKSGRAPWKVWS